MEWERQARRPSWLRRRRAPLLAVALALGAAVIVRGGAPRSDTLRVGDTEAALPDGGVAGADGGLNGVGGGGFNRVGGGNGGRGPAPSPAPGGPWAWFAEPAPIDGRDGHTALWTGREMLVWGGIARTPAPDSQDVAAPAAEPVPITTARADGAAYDPAAGRWRAVGPAPTGGRSEHTAVWTGTAMLVWGGQADIAPDDGRSAGPGQGEGPSAPDGAAYDPVDGTWSALPAAPIAGRTLHSAVWTGSEMLVWGGNLAEAESDGAAYDPASGRWRLLAPAPLPARAAHTAVWTGSEMLVWGGIDQNGMPSAGGAAYDPAKDTWRALPDAPLPGRAQHVAVWNGASMLVWGGASDVATGAAYADGAAYDPVGDRWTTLPAVDLEPRFASSAVWTGTELLVWGGVDDRFYTDGAAYSPGQGTWRAIPAAPVAAPTRYPAVWTGAELLLWAGSGEPSAAAYTP